MRGSAISRYTPSTCSAREAEKRSAVKIPEPRNDEEEEEEEASPST